jgi:hypothetical protein
MCNKNQGDVTKCTGAGRAGGATELAPYELPQLVVLSDAVAGFSAGEENGALADDVRRETLAKVRAGELTELEFEAIVFLARYPNTNYLRFREEDLGRFAASYQGQPFLRNHDVYDIGSRDGTIVASRCEQVGGIDGFRQRVRLTSQRGMEDFLQGRIDRFSIGWYYDDVLCSICHQRWFDCQHVPGRRYKPEEANGGHGREQLCELVFVNPAGKETSAVNAPAVRGTRVLGAEPGMTGDLLSILHAVREEYAMKKKLAAGALEATAELEDAAAVIVTGDELEGDDAVAGDEDEDGSAGQVVAASPPPDSSQLQALAQVRPLAGERDAGDERRRWAPALGAQELANLATALAEKLVAEKLSGVDRLLNEQHRRELDALITGSGLSEEGQDVVRLAVGDLVTAERERVESVITAQRKVEARAHENGIVHGLKPYGGAVSGVLDSMDKFRLAFEGLLHGGKPAQGVRPLSGIREAYMLLTGDFEMTGMFQRQNVGLANINTSTMADLMVEYMNKRIIRMFQEYDRFWEPLCQIEDFNNLHDIHWIVVGGIGELDVVKEGAAYTERSWTADTQTAGWVKRGNYLGLTLEAIDKDDTRRLQQAPRALAQAAWYSVGLDFTRIFTGNSGVGPGMRDGKALFHTDHGNLGTAALSVASWQATRLAMAKQKEEGSGSRLGGLTTPRYIMIPRDLEPAALTIFASEQTPGNANNDVNPEVEPGTTADARLQAARRRIIVNDFMEDANDWVAMADPRIYPNIGLGYRFGRQPELFSVADPNSGLLFSNDVLPIKVRFFYSLGPIDWRGVYKHNVAGN